MATKAAAQKKDGKRARGRPALPPEQQRARLIDAAERCFEQERYANVGIVDIVREGRPFFSLEAELMYSPLFAARNMGVDEEWLERLEADVAARQCADVESLRPSLDIHRREGTDVPCRDAD